MLVDPHVVDDQFLRQSAVVHRTTQVATHGEVEQDVLRPVERPAAGVTVVRVVELEIVLPVHTDPDAVGAPGEVVVVEGCAGVGDLDVTAVAGAAAGGVIGNAIQNRTTGDTYNITVRMDDGRRIVINTNRLGPDLREGAYVRVEGTRITARVPFARMH